MEKAPCQGTSPPKGHHNLYVFTKRIQKEMDMVTRQVVWLTLYTHVAESGVSIGSIIKQVPRQVVCLPQQWCLIWEIY